MRLVMALVLLLQSANKTTVTFESTLELEVVVRDGKGETTRLLNLARREKFAQTQVDAKTLKIDCVTSTLQKSGTDIPIEEKATALAGQSYVVAQGDGGWTVRGVDGNPPPAEGANLGAWNEVSKLLPPGGEPKAGDKWSVEGKDLAMLVMPKTIKEPAGKMDCSCDSVDGGVAKISFSGQVSGKVQEVNSNSQVTLSIKEGKLSYDLGKKRPVSASLSGSFESTADMVDVLRKPGVGAVVNNEEERRKIGEITVKSRKLEVTVAFE